MTSPPVHPNCFRELLSLKDDHLAALDLVEMNLLVAKDIPALTTLDIGRYQQMADAWADAWADAIRRELPNAEKQFHVAPNNWKNDLAFFRLGILCWYVEKKLGICYREDQRDAKAVLYTDPNDLFLNGLMDTRRGSCANMAALHVALGRRLGWPVSLACIGGHFICRFDDGKATYNIEATQSGHGGFKSDPDHYLLRHHRMAPKAVSCGSDLRGLSPRETLAVFIGSRARHLRDSGHYRLAETDYLLARYFFPNSRNLFNLQIEISVQQGMDLFEPHEAGHPVELAMWLRQVVEKAPWRTQELYKQEFYYGTFDEPEVRYDASGQQDRPAN